jgi:iron only hydrogenase large subunit-like protein
MQGPGQVNDALRDPRYRLLVFSISPQTRASFAAKYGCTAGESMRKIHWFLKRRLVDDQGAHRKQVMVFDTTFSRDFSLLESAKEFCQRFRINERMRKLIFVYN